jgi:hypothetical protein
MTTQSLVEVLMAADPTEALEKAWNSPDLTLAERAQVVSSLHMRSRMTLEGTARMTDATPAQIQALLELATLDDDDLERVSQVNPPATTWFLFADAESDAIQAGLTSLAVSSEEQDALVVRVYDAMKAVTGPTQDERIAAISGKTFGHLAHKAKEYDVLSKKSRVFLVSLAKRKQAGQPLTEKQLPWLKSILLELVERGVVCRNSADGDQEACDEVMDALEGK